MIAFILIGGCFLALVFWLLESIYQKVKSKAPKENYEIHRQIELYNYEISRRKFHRDNHKKGSVVWKVQNDLILEVEQKVKNLINKLK